MDKKELQKKINEHMKESIITILSHLVLQINFQLERFNEGKIDYKELINKLKELSCAMDQMYKVLKKYEK